MADSGISDTGDEMSVSDMLPVGFSTSHSPKSKLRGVINQKSKKTNGNNDSRNPSKRTRKESNRGERKESNRGEKKTDCTVDADDLTLLQTFGKRAAKKFVHNHTVFPNDNSFTLKNETNSFSSLLFNTLHSDSVYKSPKEFPILLSTKRSLWYTYCNQIRGELISKTKKRYFGKSSWSLLDTDSCADTVFLGERFA